MQTTNSHLDTPATDLRSLARHVANELEAMRASDNEPENVNETNPSNDKLGRLMQFDARGRPICQLKDKLAATIEMIEGEHFEDAAGHMCDLLEWMRPRIVDADGKVFGSIGAMVSYYGQHPVVITE